MKLDAKTLAEHCYFAENLKAAVSELAVTQAELGRAVGKDQKTVGRYISGETYPEGCIIEILKYLQSRLVDEHNNAHIPSEEFEELFSEIYDFLGDNGIHEVEFAEALGISQKTLNNYHNHRFNKGEALKLPTETQWKIIDAFNQLGDSLLPSDPEDDSPSQAEARSRFCKIYWKLAKYNDKLADSVSEMWQRLIESCESGKANFFVYSPEKLDLVCFYLQFLISELDGLWYMTYNELNETGKCQDYFFIEDIASIDFLYEDHDEYEGEDFGYWHDGDDQTPNYWCGLLCSEIGRFWEAYNALSPQEKSETNALLRDAFDAKTRWLNDDRDFLRSQNFVPYNYIYKDCLSSKEKISKEEEEELARIFDELPYAYQDAILYNFMVFFFGIYLENIDEVTAAHKRLRELSAEKMRKFLKKYENEILSDFRETIVGANDKIFNKYNNLFTNSWDYFAQYMSLMSFALTKNVFRHSQPSEQSAKQFRKRIRGLPKDIEPLAVMKAQLEYSAMDWYANMLADIALLKGMRIDEMLSAVED